MILVDLNCVTGRRQCAVRPYQLEDIETPMERWSVTGWGPNEIIEKRKEKIQNFDHKKEAKERIE